MLRWDFKTHYQAHHLWILPLFWMVVLPAATVLAVNSITNHANLFAGLQELHSVSSRSGPTSRTADAGADISNLGASVTTPTSNIPISGSSSRSAVVSAKSTATKSLLDKFGNYTHNSSSTVTPAYLALSTNTIILGNVYSPPVEMYISNGLEFNQPTNNTSPDIYLTWYTVSGHYSPGPYYVSWRPMLEYLHPVTSDGSFVFDISAQDRSGNTYKTTLKVEWFAKRDLGMTTGSINKQVIGSITSFTAHVNFNPTPNLIGAVIHLTSNGFIGVNSTDLCSAGETNVTFTYSGQTGYDITCSLPTATLSNYPQGFTLNGSATVNWPPAEPITSFIDFTAI